MIKVLSSLLILFINQLPAEWQKLAYGQTEDQKILTRKARNFLKGRPRVLKFDSMITNRKKVN